jgi:hypothetical protein
MAILMVFLRALDTSMGVGGRNSLLFVGKFAINANNMPFLRNIKRLVLSTKLHKHIKTSGFGHNKMFQKLFRKYLV